ncbi:MAG: hypothetical protein CR988_07815 [Treponema sp.]|nr:MAG: hypothetical protein CR988_07815 [Treponema sp.]
MADFSKDDQYFFVQDYNKYVHFHKGIPYVIENGKEVFNARYCDIYIGEMWEVDITKEEYEAQLKKQGK